MKDNKTLNHQYVSMLEEKDIIFEIFAFAQARRREVGPENVFDFSLGNPSVPAPREVQEAICRITMETDPVTLHSYSPAGGIPAVREKIAEDLNRKYGMTYKGKHIFMTCGAAAALSHALRAVTNPGDTVLTFAPCFSEYKPYTAGAGCTLRMVPADTSAFQISFDKAEEMLTEDVTAVLINSPCNPSGVVYSDETLRTLADLLRKKEKEFSHPIYLISDEPYRDIVFSDTESIYCARYYPNTITCYSFSKSLSLPGERIGYAAVHPDAAEAETIVSLFAAISRTTGHNGAPGLWQRVAAQTCMLTSDLHVYEENRNLLYDELTACGYSIVKPGGTFYMFPKSPCSDAKEFCRIAMEKDLMLVPGDDFGCPGYFRIAYCVPTEMVKKSLPVFRQVIEIAGRSR